MKGWRRLLLIVLFFLGVINSLFYVVKGEKINSAFISLFSPLAVVFVQPTFFSSKKIIINYKNGDRSQFDYTTESSLPEDRALYMLIMFHEDYNKQLSQQLVDYLLCKKNLKFDNWFIDDISTFTILSIDIYGNNNQRIWSCDN